MFLHVPPSMTRDFSLSSLKWIVFSFRKKLSTFLFISKPERNPLGVSVKHRRFMFLKWAFGGLAMFSWSGESSVEKTEEDLGAMLRLKWAHWSGINSFQLIESNINNKEVWKLIRRSQYFYPIHIPNRKLLTLRELKWQHVTVSHPILCLAKRFWISGHRPVWHPRKNKLDRLLHIISTTTSFWPRFQLEQQKSGHTVFLEIPTLWMCD